jgi:hypothetical protein
MVFFNNFNIIEALVLDVIFCYFYCILFSFVSYSCIFPMFLYSLFNRPFGCCASMLMIKN